MNPHGDEQLHFLDYWRVIKVHKFVVLTVLLLVIGSAGVYTALAPREYDSTAKINVGSDRPDVSIYGRESSQIDQITFNTQFEVIQSKEVLYPVIEQLKLKQRWAKKGNSEEISKDLAYLMMRARLRLNVVRGTTLIAITARSIDREEAAELANAVSRAYEKYRLDEKYRETNRGLEKIEQEYKIKEEEVKQARDTVEELRKALGIVDPGGLERGGSRREEQERLFRLGDELLKTKGEFRLQKSRVETLEKLPVDKLAYTLDALLDHGNPSLTEAIIALRSAEQKLSELRSGALGPNHPEVKSAEGAFLQARKNLEQKASGMFEAEKLKLKGYEDRVSEIETEVKRLQKVETESQTTKYVPFLKARDQLELAEKVAKEVYERWQKEKIERGLPTTPITVTDIAEPSLLPARPKVALNMALSVVVGLVLGVAIAFFLEYLDTSIHKIEDLEKYLHLPVLGIVPRDVKPLIQMVDAAPFAEYYRVLRANIEFSRKDAAANAITFCSAGASEGKSTTLVNTAYIYAQHGQTVLVVDSDIRRPSLHRVFGVENDVGLTDLVLKGMPIEKVVRATHIPNLFFIPSGSHQPDALGLLAMEKMKELIAQFKQWYNVVFFDSPPVLGISDATILAREVDLAVLVIQAHRFPRQFVIRAQDTLNKAGVRLIGAVLNQVKAQENDYYSYNYEYYYGGTKTKRSKKEAA
jgi:polysaccharide biosynthesis transport protein